MTELDFKQAKKRKSSDSNELKQKSPKKKKIVKEELQEENEVEHSCSEVQIKAKHQDGKKKRKKDKHKKEESNEKETAEDQIEENKPSLQSEEEITAQNKERKRLKKEKRKKKKLEEQRIKENVRKDAERETVLFNDSGCAGDDVDSSEDMATNEELDESTRSSDGKDPLSVAEMKRLKQEKKIKRKEEKKKRHEELQTDTLKQSCEQAVSYLRLWRDERDAWKFSKNKQTWLLKHMYNTQLLSDEHFALHLEYMDTMRGNIRDVTLRQAEKHAAAHEDSDADSDDDEEKTQDKKDTDSGNTKMSAQQLQRVRQVIQLLSS